MEQAMEPDLAPGFFGKVSSHGDFVSRRLPQGMLAVWDGWLQASLQASRAVLGPRWLDTYLTGPIWRFALAPGVCDSNAWAGILMPSVDRVGRHFPLTVAAGAPCGAAVLDWIANGGPWFGQLETLALSSLEHNFALERFDGQLLAMEPLSDAAFLGVSGAAGSRLPLANVDGAAAMAPHIAACALRGQSVWWTDGSAHVEPGMLMCRGLPAPAAFGAMLAGNWKEAGWG
jgi:type VI secretion system protein ImpM